MGRFQLLESDLVYDVSTASLDLFPVGFSCLGSPALRQVPFFPVSIITTYSL